jgi:hypothetical protein
MDLELILRELLTNRKVKGIEKRQIFHMLQFQRNHMNKSSDRQNQKQHETD